jgi:ATPase subunit of ABC transporter with duplicated ATPase domains
VDLFIEKGDRIAVVGPNGAGKSTLLRLLIGREKPEAGSAQIVGQNVVMNYFEQNQADALDLDKTVEKTLQDASSGQSYNELRALLGQFLFKGDSVEKKVRFLSGGEKARLSLCCMMLTPANLLILDEPTNHLDIPAKEMLEEALQHFQGSVVVVSHDRYFISKVATTIVAIEDKKLTKYQGDYKFYMEKSNALKEKVEARYVNGVSRIESAPVIDLEEMEKSSKKKSFGGAKTAHMVTRKDKGIKNAKRQKT